MNKKRYWLKFGLIFGVIALVASIPANFMAFGFSPNILGGSIVTSISSLVILPVQFLYFLGMILGGNFVREYIYLAVLLMAFIPGIFYFVVGVIIGGIYGKINPQNSSTDILDTNTHKDKKIVLLCLLLIIIGFIYIAFVSKEISQLQKHKPTFIIQ